MKHKRKNSAVWAVLPLYVAVFGYLGWFAGQCGDRFFGGHMLPSLMAVAIAVIAAFLLGLTVHEAGHLVCGLLTGYRFQSFRLFHIMWKKDPDGNIRLYRYRLAGTGGQCLMSPPELKDGDMPYVLYNLGGVLFNLLLGGLGMLLSLLFPAFAPAVIFGRTLLALNLLMALENGLPLSGTTNDGANLLSLHQCKEARQAFHIQMMGIVLLSEGKRVREFPAAWFRMPTDEQLHNTMLTVMAVYVCDRLLDEHRFSEAQAAIESLLAKDTGLYAVHRDILRTDALYCELVDACRPETVDAAVKDLEGFWKAMAQNPAVLRTRYVYEKVYRKNEEAASALSAQFEKVAGTYPYPGEIQAERELMAVVPQVGQEETSHEEV